MGLSFIFVFKQKTAYEMRISDWSSDVCSSDLPGRDALDRTSTGIDHGVEEIGVWHLVDRAAVSRTVPENAREVTAAHDIGLGRVGVDDELGDRSSGWGRLGEGLGAYTCEAGCKPRNARDGAGADPEYCRDAQGAEASGNEGNAPEHYPDRLQRFRQGKFLRSGHANRLARIFRAREAIMRSLVFAVLLLGGCATTPAGLQRSEEHTSELQSLMRNSYAVFCLKKKKNQIQNKKKKLSYIQLTKRDTEHHRTQVNIITTITRRAR